MRNISLHYFILLVMLGFSLNSIAQQTLQINSSDRKFIGSYTQYYVDSSKKADINTIVNKPFTNGSTDILNFGNTNNNVWIRFTVTSQTEKDLFLEILAPLLDQLDLYEIKNGTPKKIFSGGMNEPFYNRPVHSQNWLFDLDISGVTAHTYYIKASTGFPFQMPIVIASKDKYAEYSQGQNIFWGLYIGIILFAFIYNLFIYLSVRERRYLYYILYIIGSVTFYMGLEGFSFKFLWPNFPYFNSILPVFICVTNVIIMMFATNFLAISKKQKSQFYIGRVIMAGFIAIALANIFGSLSMAAMPAQMLSLITCIYLIVVAILALKRKVPSAKYFLIAWTLFLALVFIFILAENNVIPSNFFTTHSIFIGHITEVCLLSFALADRINWLKSENEKKQKEIIHQLQVNEQIQLEANRVLEQKVVERTAEVVEQRNEAVKQKKRSDELLLNILPEETAEELKNTGTSVARYFDQVTVMFTDIKDFTQFSERLSPKELVAEINECFSEFDHIVEKFGLEKIKTIGDSYMVAGGLPTANNTHATDIVNAALAILQFMNELKEKKIEQGKMYFELRIGVHTGPVVAGIVGVKKFAYDIWGDTVNIAARMQSSGEPGKVNISAHTYDLIKDSFNCNYRGKLEAKHKGLIDMYFAEWKN